jgi:hypothetical protein
MGEFASMARLIRPSTPEDAAAIVSLLTGVGLRPNVDAPHLYWKYWRPRADRPGPRSFVLSDDNEVLAHGANIHSTCIWEGRRLSTVHVIDWAARAGEIGAGVALMKHIGQSSTLLAIGGSAQTLRILPYIGFRSAGTVTGYVRTLHPLRLLRSGGDAPWRRLPRLARGVAATFPRLRSPDSDWQAQHVAASDLRSIAAVLPMPARGMASMERSLDEFSYSLDCPIAPMQLYAIKKTDRTKGYFMLAYAPGQVRIADCWIDSQDPADWRTMIRLATEQSRRDPNAAEVVAWANDPLLAQALLTCGFRARHQTVVQLRPASGAALPGAPLRVQMLDNDAAYLHEGRNEFWT